MMGGPHSNKQPGAATATARRPLLRVMGLSKTFPGLKALDDVALEVAAGEIVAVVGQNGSGKSTLVKILAGIHHPDTGSSIQGFNTSGASTPPVLRFIHQDLGLVDGLNTIENLDLSRPLGRRGLAPVRTGREARAAAAATHRFGGTFDVRRPVAELSAAERAIVAITRAVDGWSSPDTVLVLDEPTAALPEAEARRLFDAMRRVAASGAGVIFISHHLSEVMTHADRVVALRDGRVVADLPVAEIDESRLVSLIAGRAVEDIARNHHKGLGPRALTAIGVRGLTVRGVDLEIVEGEIVGVAGLLGSGREDLAAVLFGATSRTAGEVRVGDDSVRSGDPAQAIERGVAFVPADRRRHGAVMSMSVRENLTLPNLSTLRRAMGWLDGRREREEAQRWADNVGLAPSTPERPIELFSGGNQQKIVLAKWLRLAPKVLLLDEPTQGVDVGAKAAIYEFIARAAAAGTAVLISSSDTKELALLCDRVLIMRDGAVIDEVSHAQLTEVRLIHQIMGLGAAPDDSSTPNRGLHHVRHVG